MKVLSPRAHAPIDYLLVAVLGLAPSVLGFTDIAATLCYGVAFGVLALSLMTAYPLGVAKIIPFPVHGYVELGSAPVLAAAPWLFGFDHLATARSFFLALGVGYVLVWLLTDYRATERETRPRGVEKPHAAHESPHYSNRPMM